MTRNDLLAAQDAFSHAGDHVTQAAILARALGLSFQQECDLREILNEGEIQTYSTGHDEGYRVGWEEGRDDLRSEYDLDAMRLELTKAQAAITKIKTQVLQALDETVSEAERAVETAYGVVREGP